MNSVFSKQRGATLIVALLMLAILALLGVNAVTNSTMNLRAVSNMQAQQDAEAVAQDAIEQTISAIGPFTNPQAVPRPVTRPSYGDTVAVAVAAPICRDTRPAEGYSAAFALAPEETVWEVVATVPPDPVTGARARISQGVAITMKQGSCP